MSFKKDAQSSKEEFAPGAIQAYRILDGKYYVSRAVTIDKYGSRKTVLIHGKGKNGRDSTSVTPVEKETIVVFLDCLVKGELTTYYTRTRDGVEYYFAEDKNGVISTLDNNEILYRNPQGNQQWLKPTGQYVGAFSYFAKDYPELREEANTLKFDRREIINFSKKYHDVACKSGEQCTLFERTMVKDKVRFGLFVNATAHSFEYLYGPTQFEGNTNFFGGGVMMVRELRNVSDRLLIQLKLGYSQATLEGDYKMVSSTGTLHYSNDVSAWRFSPGATYYYPRRNLKPMLFLSPFVDFMRFSNATRDGQPLEEGYAHDKLVSIGINGGAGLQYKDHVRVTCAYEMNFKKAGYYSLGYNGLEISACYLF